MTFHKPDWLEWVTIGACLWFFVYPHPYTLVFTIVLLLPIAGLVLHGISRPSLASLVSISKKEGKNKYDLADFIEIPGLVITVRVLIDFEFESFYSILKVGSIAFVILLLFLAATYKLIEKTNKNKWLIYSMVVGNIALYSYAATYGTNCIFDRSAPKVYQAKVTDKSISRGRRHTTYYLKVEPWGNHYDPEKISVSHNRYDNTMIGEVVSIDYKKGLLGIPWYYVEE